MNSDLQLTGSGWKCQRPIRTTCAYSQGQHFRRANLRNPGKRRRRAPPSMSRSSPASPLTRQRAASQLVRLSLLASLWALVFGM